MEFCERCGSRMIRTKEGFLCPKCRKVIHVELEIQRVEGKKRNDSGSIYVSGNATDDHTRVLRQCPSCGNKEAFRWFSGVSGEHAGIRRERNVEHFRCTKCSYAWAEES